MNVKEKVVRICPGKPRQLFYELNIEYIPDIQILQMAESQ